MSLEIATEGFPLAALREIKLLSKLKHKNIVQIIGISTAKYALPEPFFGMKKAPYSYPWNFFMVCEFLEHSLKGLLTRGYKFSMGQIQSILRQRLEGLDYLHTNHVMHRDIKCSNILVNSAGEVKLADFGMGTCYDPKSLYKGSKGVVTLIYRAPELLLGQDYSEAIDMWALGCVLGEMIMGSPIFEGTNEEEQLLEIFRTLGVSDQNLLLNSKMANVKKTLNLKEKISSGPA